MQVECYAFRVQGGKSMKKSRLDFEALGFEKGQNVILKGQMYYKKLPSEEYMIIYDTERYEIKDDTVFCISINPYALMKEIHVYRGVLEDQKELEEIYNLVWHTYVSVFYDELKYEFEENEYIDQGYKEKFEKTYEELKEHFEEGGKHYKKFDYTLGDLKYINELNKAVENVDRLLCLTRDCHFKLSDKNLLIKDLFDQFTDKTEKDLPKGFTVRNHYINEEGCHTVGIGHGSTDIIVTSHKDKRVAKAKALHEFFNAMKRDRFRSFVERIEEYKE